MLIKKRTVREGLKFLLPVLEVESKIPDLFTELFINFLPNEHYLVSSIEDLVFADTLCTPSIVYFVRRETPCPFRKDFPINLNSKYIFSDYPSLHLTFPKRLLFLTIISLHEYHPQELSKNLFMYLLIFLLGLGLISSISKTPHFLSQNYRQHRK